MACLRLAWQLVTLLIRLAGNLALFWLLRLLWPDWQMETLAVALLFSVYPGYTVQPNAGVYISDLLASAAALISIALTIKVLQFRAHAYAALGQGCAFGPGRLVGIVLSWHF